MLGPTTWAVEKRGSSTVNVSSSRITACARSYRVTSHPCRAGSQDTGSAARSRARTGCGSCSSCSRVTVAPSGKACAPPGLTCAGSPVRDPPLRRPGARRPARRPRTWRPPGCARGGRRRARSGCRAARGRRACRSRSSPVVVEFHNVSRVESDREQRLAGAQPVAADGQADDRRQREDRRGARVGVGGQHHDRARPRSVGARRRGRLGPHELGPGQQDGGCVGVAPGARCRRGGWPTGGRASGRCA